MEFSQADMRNPMGTLWEMYEESLPPDASEHTKKMIQIGFYAGAMCVADGMLSAFDRPSPVPRRLAKILQKDAMKWLKAK